MTWKIPLSDIDLGEEEIAAVESVLRSRWLSMGEITAAFEQEAADYLGVRHAFAVSNGTTALHLAYAALDLEPGDEVIVPALTFVATANAVLYTGATPVFADISSLDDLTISPADIERHITPQTRAIAVMHYGGNLCDMDAVRSLAAAHGLALVEDAAHAPGSVLNGIKAGGLGDVGCFSFFSNKNLVTGEGGLVTTNRDDLAEKIRLMRSHGMTTLTWDRHRGHAYSYDVVALGYNYRMDEIRAALGREQLKKLENNNQRRREIISVYRSLLDGTPGLSIPFNQPRGLSAGHLFVVLLAEGRDRKAVIDALRDEGIQTSIHYPPVHLFSYYRQSFGLGEGLLPLSEQAGRRVLTLPLYPGMQDAQVRQVVDRLKLATEM